MTTASAGPERPPEPAGPWAAIAPRWRRILLIYCALGLIFAVVDELPALFQPEFVPVGVLAFLYMVPFVAALWPVWLLVRLFAGVRF
jgi:hypothetical protein